MILLNLGAQNKKFYENFHHFCFLLPIILKRVWKRFQNPTKGGVGFPGISRQLFPPPQIPGWL